MSKGKIIRIKLGNNPTSSATQYQLFPSIFAAVKAVVYVAGAALGLGILDSLNILIRHRGARFAGRSADKSDQAVSAADVLALTIKYIRKEYRLIIQLAPVVTIISLPIFIFSSIVMLMLLEGNQEIPQMLLNGFVYVFLTCLVPASVINHFVSLRLAADLGQSAATEKQKATILANAAGVYAFELGAIGLLFFGQRHGLVAGQGGPFEFLPRAGVHFGPASYFYTLIVLVFLIVLFGGFEIILSVATRRALLFSSGSALDRPTRVQRFKLFWLTIACAYPIIAIGIVIGFIGFMAVEILIAGGAQTLLGLVGLGIIMIFVLFASAIPAVAVIFANLSDEKLAILAGKYERAIGFEVS